MIDKQFAKNLAVEVCKDLDYDEVYLYAEKFLALKFKQKFTFDELWELYGERYDYIFQCEITWDQLWDVPVVELAHYTIQSPSCGAMMTKSSDERQMTWG